MAYVYIPVKTGAIGSHDVAKFRDAVRQSAKPVIAHCRTGTRSYLLCGAGEALEGGRSPAEIVEEAKAAGYDMSSCPPWWSDSGKNPAGGSKLRRSATKIIQEFASAPTPFSSSRD